MISDMQFKRIEIADRDIFQRYQINYPTNSCEYNFTNLFCWRDSCQTRWCEYNDHLLVIYDNNNMLLFPWGEFLPPAELLQLFEQLSPLTCKLIYDVPEEYLQIYPETENHFTITSDPAEFDYIYEVEKLRNFSGRKLRKKRNLIKQLLRDYSEVRCEPLAAQHIADCLELAIIQTGYKAHAHDDLSAIKNYFAAFEQLHEYGSVLYTAEKLIGFSVISRLNHNSFCEHFEKVDYNYKGAPQMLVNYSAKQLPSEAKYLNREQDMGLIGLRHSKQSYDPARLLKRYNLSQKH